MRETFNIFIKNSRKLYFIINILLLCLSFVNSIISNSHKIMFLNNYLSFEEAEKNKIDQTSGFNENCLLIMDYIRYDLSKLSDEERILENDGNKIIYQFCKNIPGNKSSVIFPEEGKIIKLAGDINGEEGNKNKITYNSNETSIILHLAKGDQCLKDNLTNYSFTIKLICDNTKEFEFPKINNYDPRSTCNFDLEAYSKYACGDNDAYAKSKILNEYRIAFGIGFCIIGLFIGILGYRNLNFGIILVCVVSCPIVLRYLIYESFNIENAIALYVISTIGLIIGGVISYLLTRRKKYRKIYMCIIGGIFGYLIGKFLYDVLITLIETTSQKLIYYLVLVIFTIIGVVSGIFFAKITCIIGTSTLGGYSFMRGISLFLSKVVEYFDENKVFDYARTGNYEQIGEMIGAKFYIYPAMWIVFTIVFILIQNKINPKINDIDDYKRAWSAYEIDKGNLVEYQDTAGNSILEGEDKE